MTDFAAGPETQTESATPDTPRPIPARAVVSWVLYDLANTIFSMGVVSAYFSIWVRQQVGADREGRFQLFNAAARRTWS